MPLCRNILRVIFFPDNSGNPYQALLCRELRLLGVDVDYYHKLPSNQWLFNNRHSITVLHAHWLETSYYRGKNLALRILSFLWFIQRLFLAKILGYKIVWTAHNIMPHERTCPTIDFLARFFVIWCANEIIVHCNFAKSEISSLFHRKRNIYTIPHGSYVNVYSDAAPREEIRKEIGIEPESYVYLFFGQIRPYKGIFKLIETFKAIDDPKSILIIAGECNHVNKESIYEKIKEDKRILLFGYRIPENEVAKLFTAADCLVAPFQEILTSGSVILGLSFGLPIIAPSLGCMPEIIKGEAGLTYYQADDDGLLNSMINLRRKDREKMRHAALKIAESLEWKGIAEKTMDLYQL